MNLAPSTTAPEPGSQNDPNLTLAEVIETTVRNGNKLDFGTFVTKAAAKCDAYDLAAVDAAQAIAFGEDDLVVDDCALTSRGDDGDGCYVMAWQWIPAETIRGHVPSTTPPLAPQATRESGGGWQ